MADGNGATKNIRPLETIERIDPTRNFFSLDATCPLVTKVHVEAERHCAAGRESVLIGHAGHPEVEGTMGQLPDGAVTLIETPEDAERFQPRDPASLAYVTQTTLSLDDTAEIIGVLKRRFPGLPDPHKEDICYATTNRQEAVKRVAAESDLVLVIGSPNSSNSVRLVEVARRAGAKAARLVDDAAAVDWSWFEGVSTVGVTAGASAPEVLVENVIETLRRIEPVEVVLLPGIEEKINFRLPEELAAV